MKIIFKWLGLFLTVYFSYRIFGFSSWLLLLVIIGLGLGFYQLESSRVNIKLLALGASLTAFTAVIRIPFAGLMSLQPTYFMVLLTGRVLGWRIGFLVGAGSIFLSSLYIGFGPWSIWQMIVTGLIGISGYFLKFKMDSIWYWAFLGGIWGYFYGWIMNFWHWLTFVYPLNWQTFLVTYGASLIFDTVRALGNVLFILIFFRSFERILLRIQRRIWVERIIERS